jgi:hypothetical protein
MSDFAEYDGTHQYGQPVPGVPPFVSEVSIGDEAVEDGYGDTGSDDELGQDYYGDAPDIGVETDWQEDTAGAYDEPAELDLGAAGDNYGAETVDLDLPAAHPATFGRHAAAVGRTILTDGRTVAAPELSFEARPRTLEFEVDLRGTPAEGTDLPASDTDTEYRPPAYPRRVYRDTYEQPGFGKWYEADADDLRSRPMQGEVRPSNFEEGVIDKVDRSIVEIGDEVGVDMRGALQPLEEHHIFPDKPSYVHGIERRFGATEAAKLEVNRGFFHPQAGLIWTRQGDPFDDAFGLTHEKIHGVSLEVVTPEPLTYTTDAQGAPQPQYAARRVAIGYQDLCPQRLSDAHGATEFVTDMATNKSMIMSGYGPIDPLYRAIDILGGHAVLETARAYGVKPLEVENQLIKGMWTPDRTGMERVREVLGDERFDRFIHLTATMTGRAAERAAQELGWDFAIDDLVKAGVGKFNTYFDWRRRRYAV